MKAALVAAALVAAGVPAFAVGCASEEGFGSVEQGAQPIDRLLIGRASQYPADRAMRSRLALLSSSMTERRKVAWSIIEKVVAPVKIAARPGRSARPSLPRFQTWYSREDVLPMFDRLFRALPDVDKIQRAHFGAADVDAIFPWNASMAPTLPSFTEERRRARLAELKTPSGVHSLGKDARVLMSPAYVSHLLRSYPEIVGCNVPAGDAAPPSETNFASCLLGEFPNDAVAVKARWVPGDSPIATYDTSKASLASKFAAGRFGDGDGQANPNEDAIYTMQLTADTTMRLAALHIMTKELRDWMWISLWWSNEPDSDFGSDRPAGLSALGGPWGHYKMCVNVAYEEGDLGARMDASDPASWCANPYLEQAPLAVKTSCIGCHQSGGTQESSASILAAPDRFPNQSRVKVRRNFPADYAFTTTGGLELASSFRATIDALSGHR